MSRIANTLGNAAVSHSGFDFLRSSAIAKKRVCLDQYKVHRVKTSTREVSRA